MTVGLMGVVVLRLKYSSEPPGRPVPSFPSLQQGSESVHLGGAWELSTHPASSPVMLMLILQRTKVLIMQIKGERFRMYFKVGLILVLYCRYQSQVLGCYLWL